MLTNPRVLELVYTRLDINGKLSLVVLPRVPILQVSQFGTPTMIIRLLSLTGRVFLSVDGPSLRSNNIKEILHYVARELI